MHTSSLPAVVPVLLIGLLSLLTPALTPRTVQFGVRIPAERATDPVVTAARRTYRISTAAVTVVAALVALFLGSVGAAVAVAVLIELAGSTATYLVARSHVTAAKHAGRWFEGRPQVTVTDTTLRTAPEPFPWLWTLPAAALTVATAIVGAVRYPNLPPRLVSHYDTAGHPTSYTDTTFAAAFAPVMVQVGVTALIVTLTRVTARSKAALDVQDPHAAARHRRFVTLMARGVLVLAAATDLSMFFEALALWKVIGSTGFLVPLLFAPVLIAVAGLVVVAVRVGQGGSRLRFEDDAPDGDADDAAGAADPAHPASQGKPTSPVNRDDDRSWRLGIIYFNREDPAVFVQKRFGVGWTVNFARPTAVALMVGIVAIPLLLPLLLHSH